MRLVSQEFRIGKNLVSDVLVDRINVFKVNNILKRAVLHDKDISAINRGFEFSIKLIFIVRFLFKFAGGLIVFMNNVVIKIKSPDTALLSLVVSAGRIFQRRFKKCRSILVKRQGLRKTGKGKNGAVRGFSSKTAFDRKYSKTRNQNSGFSRTCPRLNNNVALRV